MCVAVGTHLANAFSLHVLDGFLASFCTRCGVNLSWPDALALQQQDPPEAAF